jgi:hypothetical protein
MSRAIPLLPLWALGRLYRVTFTFFTCIIKLDAALIQIIPNCKTNVPSVAIGEKLSEIVSGSTASSPDIDVLYIYKYARILMERCVQI